MKRIKVSSLPFKDVLNDIAKALNIPVTASCNEYSIALPKNIGEGAIKGINFENGLGIIVYNCKFLNDIQFDFIVNKVHPLKYIYSVEGEVVHYFEKENEKHRIDTYKCAIVASNEHNGHVLEFKAQEKTTIISLEIDREKFNNRMECELDNLNPDLKKLFTDINAEEKFYHLGHYSLEFQDLFAALDKFEDKKLIRRIFLESKSSEIFVNQILQFEDDMKSDSDKTILRKNEIESIKNAAKFIKDNIKETINIQTLSEYTGLNPNKLQEGFRYLYESTINEYIHNYRMELAMELLKKTDISVSEICYAVGLSSRSYFSRKFKERYQILPSLIRRD